MNVARPAYPGDPMTDRDRLLARASRVLPRWTSTEDPASCAVFTRSQGAYVWDTNGKRFLDHLAADGAILIGHADPRVNGAAAGAAALIDATATGLQVGEVDLGELIAGSVPSAQKVVLLTTSSEAIGLALRLARRATGRTGILGFHRSLRGWVSAQGALGPPDRTVVHPVDALDEAAVRTAFTEHGPDMSAVLVEVLEPGSSRATGPGLLRLLRQQATRHGAVLVFDEVRTGFRHHLGGYQAVVGVVPDLTVLGGALGNGWTIAALAGRTDLMDDVAAAGRPLGDQRATPYAIAAARRTLDLLADGAVAHLDRLGRRLRKGLDEAIAGTGAPAVVRGLGSAWLVDWPLAPGAAARGAVADGTGPAQAFRRAMLDEGVLLAPGPLSHNRLCAAFSDDDVDDTVEAARRAFAAVV